MGLILGIDYGTRRVGLATGDDLTGVAVTAGQLDVRGDDDALAQIAAVCRDRGVDRIVIGVPLNMNGTPGPMAAQVRAFADRLRALPGINEVREQDERLSSVQAERALLEGDLSRNRRKASRDAVAAQILLQSHLDARAYAQEGCGDADGGVP